LALQAIPRGPDIFLNICHTTDQHPWPLLSCDTSPSIHRASLLNCLLLLLMLLPVRYRLHRKLPSVLLLPLLQLVLLPPLLRPLLPPLLLLLLIPVPALRAVSLPLLLLLLPLVLCWLCLLLLLWQVQTQPCTDVCKVLIHGLRCSSLGEPHFMQLLARRSQQVKHLKRSTQRDSGVDMAVAGKTTAASAATARICLPSAKVPRRLANLHKETSRASRRR
jgi:hypothetical protein